MSTKIVQSAQSSVAALPSSLSAAVELNPRQISFVENYLECRVLWKAAQLAGYSGDMNACAVQANELINNPKVLVYYGERLKSLQVSAEETLAEIGQIARSPWEKHVAVKYNDTGEVVQAQLRLQDKLKALELAGKYHKLLGDRVESELSGNDVERLSDSIIAGLFAAAQKRRDESSTPPLALNPAPDTVSGGQPSS